MNKVHTKHLPWTIHKSPWWLRRAFVRNGFRGKRP